MLLMSRGLLILTEKQSIWERILFPNPEAVDRVINKTGNAFNRFSKTIKRNAALNGKIKFVHSAIGNTLKSR